MWKQEMMTSDITGGSSLSLPAQEELEHFDCWQQNTLAESLAEKDPGCIMCVPPAQRLRRERIPCCTNTDLLLNSGLTLTSPGSKWSSGAALLLSWSLKSYSAVTSWYPGESISNSNHFLLDVCLSPPRGCCCRGQQNKHFLLYIDTTTLLKFQL